MSTKTLSTALAATLLLWGSQAPYVQADATATAVSQVSYRIAPGALSQALLQLSSLSGIQIIAPSHLTNGLDSRGLDGTYDIDSALSRLLDGSGLGYRLNTQRNIVTLYSLSASSGRLQLDAVNVEGWTGQASGGANGSTDVTATEGSDSYTTTAISIGSKTPQSLKETPQTVSVITQQQIKSQNITDLSTAMSKATGITVQQSGVSQKYYSRGWEVDTVQIDGGTPFKLNDSLLSRTGSSLPLIDMSMYDHVELLRGGDSLNNVGTSNPGGSINLVRKRPLDHLQTTFEAQAGSWDNYRSSVDVTGPIAFDGHLRGRAVATWQDRDYFYDTANDDNKLVYAILEADLTDDTLLSFGGSHSRKRSVPWSYGLPRYLTGRDAKLSRSTGLGLPWSRMDADSNEVFVQLKQKLGDHWDLSAQVTQLTQNYDLTEGALIGGVPNAGVDDTARFSQMQGYGNRGKQLLADANLSGNFDVFGLPQKVSLSTSRQKNTYDSYDLNGTTGEANLDVPEPVWSVASNGNSTYTQSNIVAKIDTVFLPFLPDLHFQTAARWDKYQIDSSTQYEVASTQIKGNESRHSTPYYALRYDFTPEWSAYASYTRLYEYQAYLKTVNDTPLPPMTGNTKEVGIKYSSGSLNASLSAYRSERKNLATSEFNFACAPIFYCFDVGSAKEESKGIDFEIAGEPLPWWSTTFGYSYNDNEQQYDPRDVTSGKTNVPLSSFTPKHQTKLWNEFRLNGNPYLNKTRLGLGLITQSKSFSSGEACASFNGPTCAEYKDYEFTQGFYTVVSTRASYELDEHWGVALNIENLFDRRYYSTLGGSDSGNWYGTPRNYMLTVNGKF